MNPVILKNKPLIEAIFELRWELQPTESHPEIRFDPHYPVAIGAIYDQVKGAYPFVERLPTADIPQQIANYVVQHRFRKAEGQWPLIQIGPGIITVNDTDGYVWDDFEERIHHTVDVLFKALPELKIASVALRYLDAVEFPFDHEIIFGFLREKMKTGISMPESLFVGTGVERKPLALDFRIGYLCSKPKGAVSLRFFRGKKGAADALVWETTVQSAGTDAPRTARSIRSWVKNAHALTDDWFFKIIEGELRRRFE